MSKERKILVIVSAALFLLSVAGFFPLGDPVGPLPL